jgi:hypothetical protein
MFQLRGGAASVSLILQPVSRHRGSPIRFYVITACPFGHVVLYNTRTFGAQPFQQSKQVVGSNVV